MATVTVTQEILLAEHTGCGAVNPRFTFDDVNRTTVNKVREDHGYLTSINNRLHLYTRAAVYKR